MKGHLAFPAHTASRRGPGPSLCRGATSGAPHGACKPATAPALPNSHLTSAPGTCVHAWESLGLRKRGSTRYGGLPGPITFPAGVHQGQGLMSVKLTQSPEPPRVPARTQIPADPVSAGHRWDPVIPGSGGCGNSGLSSIVTRGSGSRSARAWCGPGAGGEPAPGTGKHIPSPGPRPWPRPPRG